MHPNTVKLQRIIFLMTEGLAWWKRLSVDGDQGSWRTYILSNPDHLAVFIFLEQISISRNAQKILFPVFTQKNSSQFRVTTHVCPSLIQYHLFRPSTFRLFSKYKTLLNSHKSCLSLVTKNVCRFMSHKFRKTSCVVCRINMCALLRYICNAHFRACHLCSRFHFQTDITCEPPHLNWPSEEISKCL